MDKVLVFFAVAYTVGDSKYVHIAGDSFYILDWEDFYSQVGKWTNEFGDNVKIVNQVFVIPRAEKENG